MTKRQVIATALFAVLWTAWMIWWSGNYTPAHVAILSAIGALVALCWAWAMRRFGYWT